MTSKDLLAFAYSIALRTSAEHADCDLSFSISLEIQISDQPHEFTCTTTPCWVSFVGGLSDTYWQIMVIAPNPVY